jgi:hypothetical protein
LWAPSTKRGQHGSVHVWRVGGDLEAEGLIERVEHRLDTGELDMARMRSW